MRIILLCVIGLAVAGVPSFAQLPSGSVAPNLVMQDIFGQTHNLYETLDEGKMVILEISATWCLPCWSYFNGGAMKTLYNQFGPPGEDRLRVWLVEGDPATNLNCLYGFSGCNSYSPGNWVAGTPYPIFNNDQAAALYQIAYYPSIFLICPNRKVYILPQLSAADIWEIARECPVAYGTHNAGLFAFDSGYDALEMCDSATVQSKVQLVNLGAAPLLSALLRLSWNDTLLHTEHWSGYLSQYDEQAIALPAATIGGPGTLHIEADSLNGGIPDEQPDNNIRSKTFMQAPVFDEQHVLLRLRTDKYGSETYWELRNHEGDVLYSGGNQTVGPQGGGGFPTGIVGGPGAYPNQTLIRDTFTLSPGCYAFHIVDAYGDGICCANGNGFYRLYNLSNPGAIIIGGGDFGASETRNFMVSPTVSVAQTPALEAAVWSVYPNPASEAFWVYWEKGEWEQGVGSVFDALGRRVAEFDLQASPDSPNEIHIPVANWPSGIYYVRLQSGFWAETKPLMLAR